LFKISLNDFLKLAKPIIKQKIIPPINSAP